MILNFPTDASLVLHGLYTLYLVVFLELFPSIVTNVYLPIPELFLPL